MNTRFMDPFLVSLPHHLLLGPISQINDLPLYSCVYLLGHSSRLRTILLDIRHNTESSAMLSKTTDSLTGGWAQPSECRDMVRSSCPVEEDPSWDWGPVAGEGGPQIPQALGHSCVLAETRVGLRILQARHTNGRTVPWADLWATA